MRVLTTNRAATASLLADGGGALLAAPGYSRDALVDGRLDSVWRAATMALTHRIVFDLGTAASCNAAAVFDLYAAAVIPQRVSVYTGTSASGPWTKRADLAHGGRRDWGAAFTAVSSRYWMMELAPSPLMQSRPEVGELWLGFATEIPGAAALSQSIEHQVEVTGSQATKMGEARAALSIGWRALDAAGHEAVSSFLAAADGALRPVVLWPRPTQQGRVYLVRMANSIGWSEDLDLYDGHGLEAVELERVLRG
jgi:hypothetical protein